MNHKAWAAHVLFLPRLAAKTVILLIYVELFHLFSLYIILMYVLHYYIYVYGQIWSLKHNLTLENISESLQAALKVTLRDNI